MSDDEPIPCLAEALTEIRRLRARIAELEGAPKHSLPDAASIKMFAEAVATMRAGTLEQPTPDEPATIEHNIPPNAPPHNE